MTPSDFAGFSRAGLDTLRRVLCRATGRCLHCRAPTAAHLCEACALRLPPCLVQAVGRGEATVLECVRWLEGIDAEGVEHSTLARSEAEGADQDALEARCLAALSRKGRIVYRLSLLEGAP